MVKAVSPRATRWVSGCAPAGCAAGTAVLDGPTESSAVVAMAATSTEPPPPIAGCGAAATRVGNSSSSPSRSGSVGDCVGLRQLVGIQAQPGDIEATVSPRRAAASW
jgi:hypothetical protein